MPSTTAEKLKIKEGFTLRTLHAPADFYGALGTLPPGVTISDMATNYQQIHWFVQDKPQVDEEIEQVVDLLKKDVTCWIYFPKGSSKRQSNLTRDKGWESLQKHKELQWLSLVSFNETWSAFAVRLQTDAGKKKKETPKDRPVLSYIDAAKKIVYLPDDLAAALNGATEEKAFFESLSFTNKKEYVEWIVSAKREETRNTRLQQSLTRLANRWKNPSNR